MTDISDLNAQNQAVGRALFELEQLKYRLEESDKTVIRLTEELGRLEKEANPYRQSVRDAAEVLKARRETAREAQVSHDELTAQEALLKQAAGVFGPAGLRAHILDTVTPYLNERTAHYLGAISDGNLTATWSTLSTTAKGEAREQFNIQTQNRFGSQSFQGLSGGEKRKVRLATAMALQDLVASRAAKPIEFFVADEIDQALDEAGLERLMGILEEKAREKGTVLVISHHSLKSYIRNVITVIKEGGVSRLEGAA